MSVPPPPPGHGHQPPPHGAPYGPPYGPPYGQPPGPQYGQPPGPAYGGVPPYGPPPRTNPLAITSLVLAVAIGFLPIGLIMGIVALSQIRARGEKGRGLAIGGIVVSSVQITLVLVFIAFAVLADSGGDSEASGFQGPPGTAFALREGDCFDAPNGLGAETLDVDELTCDGPHDGEVYQDYTVAGSASDPYPGRDQIEATANERCPAEQFDYAMDAWKLPAEVQIYFYVPTMRSWDQGDRTVSCIFGLIDGTKLTGTLRTEARDLGAHQLSYVQAANRLNSAMAAIPQEEKVADDLPAHKDWAGDVAEALAEEERMLRGHDWPDRSEESVLALAESAGSAQQHWRKASRAPDVDTYLRHYDKAYAGLGQEHAKPAREALGLDATPPGDWVAH